MVASMLSATLVAVVPPPPPLSPTDRFDPTNWCDERHLDADGNELDGPCLIGLPWWAWLVLGISTGACLCGWVCCVATQIREQSSPLMMLDAFFAIFSAAHASDHQNRLHGRKPSADSSHHMDILEARSCCCCLPVPLGLALVGLLDLGRLVNAVLYAHDSIAAYDETEPGGTYEGLMVPEAHRIADRMLWASLVISYVKVAIWALYFLTACCESTFVLRLLLLWLPCDVVHSIVFCINHSQFALELCWADLQIADASGHVGYRRWYIDELPDGPLQLDERGVPEACHHFFRQEVLIGVGDVLLALALALLTAYYGGSLLRRWAREDRVAGGGGFTGGAPYRV